MTVLKVLFLLCLVHTTGALTSQTLVDGPNLPATTNNCASCDGVPWMNNPPNWFMFFLPPDSFSTILFHTDFNFSIPAGGIITGVEVNYSSDFLSPAAKDTLVQLAYNGALIGANMAMDSAYSQIPRTYGDSLTMWGATLTPSIVNHPSFGFGLRIDTDTAPVNGGLPAPTMSIYYYNATTGSMEVAHSTTIRLFYSYSDNTLRIISKPGTYYLRIIDVLGKVILFPQVFHSDGQVDFRFPDALPSGVYVAILSDVKGQLIFKDKFNIIH